MPIALIKPSVALISAALLAGAASAAIDWGDKFQEFTGPACWATPIEGGNMAWTLDQPHFQKTRGGPVLARTINLKKEGTDILDLAIKADRAIRMAAKTEKIAIAGSTILLMEIKENAPADYDWSIIVAVPVMPSENKSPRPEWGVTRIDFPATKVAHMRHESTVSDLIDAIGTVQRFILDAAKTPEGKNLSFGLYSVTEFYDIENDAKGGKVLFETCVQIKES